MVAVPPLRRYFRDGPREKIPMTYPSKSLWLRLLRECGCRTIKETVVPLSRRNDANYRVQVPKGPRKIPEGYDDE